MNSVLRHNDLPALAATGLQQRQQTESVKLASVACRPSVQSEATRVFGAVSNAWLKRTWSAGTDYNSHLGRSRRRSRGNPRKSWPAK